MSLVKLGEQHGRLEAVLSGIADRYDRQLARLQNFKAKMALPACVFLLAIFITPIPAIARGDVTGIGIAISLLKPMLVCVILVGIVIFTYRGITQSKTEIGDLLVRIPLIGSLARDYAQVELLERLALFEQAGYPLVEGAQATISSMPRFLKLARHDNFVSNLQNGKTFSESLKEANIFTPSIYAVILSGEHAGSLGDMLAHAAKISRSELDTRIDRWLEWLPRFAYAAIVIYVAMRITL